MTHDDRAVRVAQMIACASPSRLMQRCLATSAAAVLLACFGSSSAFADFRLCNKTKSRVGVALGYKDGEIWITEGWWNIAANSCETLLRGTLVARYYYVYAIDYDHGGDWGGKAFMCSREKEFTIQGIDDCLARGFDRTGFFEIDTGEQQSWTVQLTEPGADTAQLQQRPFPADAQLQTAGLIAK